MKINLMPKFIVSLLILAVVLAVAISLFSYYTSKTYLEDMYADRVTINCHAIASLLPMEDVKEVIAPGGDSTKAYDRTVRLLNKLKKEGNVTYLSLVVPDEDSVTFYVDAMVPEMGDNPDDQIPYGSDILYVDAASDEADLQNYLVIWEQYKHHVSS